MNELTVTISVDEYLELLNDSEAMAALMASGVDSWDWYDAALDGVVYTLLDDIQNKINRDA